MGLFALYGALVVPVLDMPPACRQHVAGQDMEEKTRFREEKSFCPVGISWKVKAKVVYCANNFGR